MMTWAFRGTIPSRHKDRHKYMKEIHWPVCHPYPLFWLSVCRGCARLLGELRLRARAVGMMGMALTGVACSAVAAVVAAQCRLKLRLSVFSTQRSHPRSRSS